MGFARLGCRGLHDDGAGDRRIYWLAGQYWYHGDGCAVDCGQSFLFIDESRRGEFVQFRPASSIAAYLALLKTSDVIFHGLTSGFAADMFVAVGAMPHEFNRMAIGPLEYGLFFAMTSVGYIFVNFINGLLVGRVGVVRMAYVGSLLKVLVPMLMPTGGLTGLLTPLLLSFLCFCFGVCNGRVIANVMICSTPPGRNSGAGTGFWG